MVHQTDTVIVFPADTHSGSPVGLMPPGQWAFANGGHHDPDDDQRMIAKLWERAWKRVAGQRKGKRLIVVHVGDAVEGKHHDSTEVITPRIDEHERIHVTMMEQALEIAGFSHEAGDLLYYVKGTPAHVGQGGASEERIAREFEDHGIVPRIPPKKAGGKDGRYLWDRLRLQVNSKLFDIAHHGGSVGAKPWTRTNALRSKLQEVYFEAVLSQETPPDVWLRADRHQRAHDIYVAKNGHIMQGFITPAFQGRTEFGYKVAADRPPSLGLLWMEVTAGGIITPSYEVIERETDKVIKV